jgi:threonine aldolase
MKYIDLRSDTITQPTALMREAMLTAQVGDDVYEEDIEINELQELAAQMVGKEASLFVPSGTMGNQLAIMTHTKRGDEIIAGLWSHIAHHEAGGAAVLSNVSTRTIQNPDNIIYPQDIKKYVRPTDDFHQPRTTLLCLENALATGDVVPLEVLQADYQVAKELGLMVHMDGARLFNAAVHLYINVKEIAACTDSLMFCLSKGLCAPVGSMLCGSKEFIEKAKRNRKLLGGGMRQAGFLGACGKIALKDMTIRLSEDHENARYLADGLSKIPFIKIDVDQVKISMVFFAVEKPGFNEAAFSDYLLQQGIKNTGFDLGKMRLVTNYGVSREDIDFVLTKIRTYLG